MKQVPYHNNTGNACALACYTMVAQYLMPEAGITFEQLAKIGNWREGYVVWEYPIWNWLLDRGVYIVDYEPSDIISWAGKGVDGLEASVPAKEFEWYKRNTYDLDEVTESVKITIHHPSFTLINRVPVWADVVAEYGQPGICDVTLNSKVLNHEEGVAVHRVVLLDITEDEVVFHDPNLDGSGIHRREPLSYFRNSFESLESRALARYSVKQ
ncbi:MAG TPA: hypothetical protein VMB52_03635 [Verrucomicrobiae bacterium]|nr:hypothetical protein [Verrucomicrobiae bacterium]